MLDREGFRPNVGIVLCNAKNEVFWGQTDQGAFLAVSAGRHQAGESPEEAMFRELQEEVGLLPDHVRILGRTREWLRYEVPTHWIKREWRGSYKGQKQIWFLLRLVGRDSDVSLRANARPEFDAWRWNNYWVPLDAVIEFKRNVYVQALTELRALSRRRLRERRCRQSVEGPPGEELDPGEIGTAVELHRSTGGCCSCLPALAAGLGDDEAGEPLDGGGRQPAAIVEAGAADTAGHGKRRR